MEPMQFRGRFVLVTGASSGLGRDMARLLAAEHGANLVLVARREERLHALSRELKVEHGTECHVIAADLARDDDVERVFHEATRRVPIYGVVLNAGVTHFGPHAALSWAAFRDMLATNVSSVVRLSSQFVSYLEARGEGGGIMIVGSMAGFTPTPFQSAYSGTKGFLSQYVRALHEELRGSRVSLTLFAPGGIATELTVRTGLSRYFKSSLAVMESERCAREALVAFQRRRRSYVPGLMNRVSLLAARLLPDALTTRVVGSAYRRALALLQSDSPS